MSFTESVMKDVFEYFDHVFSGKQGPEIISLALDGKKPDVAKDLYDFYTKNRKLTADLENKEFTKLAKEYNTALIKTIKVLRNTKMSFGDVAEFSPWDETLTSTVRFFDPQHKKPLSYRVYCNIRVEHLEAFLKEFLKLLFTTTLQCPHCKGIAKFNQEEQKITCNKCINTDFFFVIKMHQPVVEKGEEAAEGKQDRLMSESVVLRRDKIIFGFSDKNILKSIVGLIKQVGNTQIFSDKTPYLTHPIFPGVGISLEPTETEREDYARASQETEEIISFEHYLTNIIADDFVNLVESEEDTVKDIMAEWTLEHKHHLYEKLKAQVILPLQNILNKDQRLSRLFAEMENIKIEMGSLEG